MKKRNRLLSVLLVLAMLIAGMTFVLPASAAGGEFANDEAAIAAGVFFPRRRKVLQNIVRCL